MTATEIVDLTGPESLQYKSSQDGVHSLKLQKRSLLYA
jgi:hypothetical protein